MATEDTSGTTAETESTTGSDAQPIAIPAPDAVSLVQATEAHLDELATILQRQRVLSIQSANGTYSEEDRSAIQIEIDELTDEIDRIADQADFNRMRMLTDASAEANVKAADELGMTPAKINDPASLANAQASWTLRAHVGANTNEALAVNLFAANTRHLFAGETDAADAGQGEPLAEQRSIQAAGPVNVMTATDANSSIAKIDIALRSVTDQRANLGAFQNRLESAIRSADYTVEGPTANDAPEGGGTVADGLTVEITTAES
ncbi:adenylate kinase [Streptomyces lunaelactis]|uniref:flagellin N-terminal helical domain-containing protein n=1 Tax=Streptomyces lunaelactis TaxID=1535768 RepID=UPI0015844B1C|nr:adenylate kinase [Streptomyces lunaelactis]NUK07851.1 adenylate kinase [Streptomyces lunaelactis]NUK37479.1 adenylate kinase [Streptomyces lunaelactis]NUK40595.1 adenylate kinase [Streptomyces lunaelactis]NUK71054.1 adenylate kinase [Streptomyces lunaelactis]NUK82421.1 adenylate kinase [Streptomyces lunaelactis]